MWGRNQGVTERGNTWYIIQDSPVSFHITVTDKETIAYDHMERPSNMEHLMEYVREVEHMLYKTDLTNAPNGGIIQVTE